MKIPALRHQNKGSAIRPTGEERPPTRPQKAASEHNAADAIISTNLAHGWTVAVVIPAQNEAATIESCVASVIEALDACTGLSGSWIVIVADACSDNTAALAQACLGDRGEVIECTVRSPGTARGIGADAALSHFSDVDLSRLWMANTDADTRVPANWVERHLDLALAGYKGVAGVVSVDAVQGCDVSTGRQLLTDYQIFANGSHPHVHGANLGVRADAFVDVGGWSHLNVAEDHCLWRRLSNSGWKVTSPADSVVVTSGRLVGRAVGGFADLLRSRLRNLRLRTESNVKRKLPTTQGAAASSEGG